MLVLPIQLLFSLQEETKPKERLLTPITYTKNENMTNNLKHPSNQLDKVICQIRFPALLEIDNKISDFQNHIKKEYPNYSKSVGIQTSFIEIPDTYDHVFTSSNKQWSISVSISAMSLTTSSYVNWDDFKIRYLNVINALTDVFDIDSVGRIGLRYINAIRPSSMKVSNLSEIISEPYINMIDCKLGSILGFNTIIDCGLKNNIQARIALGLIQFSDDSEQGFLIDNDVFSTKKICVNDIMGTLDTFNSESVKLFCEITTKKMQKEVGM